MTLTVLERGADAFTSGDVPVAVHGLGKMGLPLAAVYAETTGNVTGVDVDERVVERVNAGESPVQREPGLPELVADLVADGALRATTDGVAAAREAAVHVVIVPTLVTDDHDPDLSAVRAAVDSIARGLSPGDLVVLESTLPPGATESVVRPHLADESGLDPGEFGVAVCPERTSSGRALRDVRGAHPKVVGGVDAESTRAAELVYGELVDNDVVTVTDATTAEAVKVFEGLYRDVNIALANELAQLADDLGADVRDAIAAANTQPYCDIHTPGPGVGGHCIPYYPYFVLGWLDAHAPMLRTARTVNDGMPAFVVQKVAEGLAATRTDPAVEVIRDPADAGRAFATSASPGDDLLGARVLVLGLTYRAGVAETRASPARGVCSWLSDLGADVFATDPLVDAAEFEADYVPVDAVEDVRADAAVLVTAHDEFADVDWSAFDPMVVVDARDALDVGDAGHRVYTVGRGWE